MDGDPRLGIPGRECGDMSGQGRKTGKRGQKEAPPRSKTRRVSALRRGCRDPAYGATFGGVEAGFISEIMKDIAKRDAMAKELTA
jgi:hypothetical protein